MKTSVVTIPVGAVLKNRCSSAVRDMKSATWPEQQHREHHTKRGQMENKGIRLSALVRKQTRIAGVCIAGGQPLRGPFGIYWQGMHGSDLSLAKLTGACSRTNVTVLRKRDGGFNSSETLFLSS